ncbi:MAG: hypothetical protein KGM15_10840 [Pseudomonadota bacterium]|nr:hypothetical protein [Pseudomonadota bacterium]
MTGHDQTVLALGLGYALLGVVLLIILVFARLDWRLKAALIVVVSGFYAVDYRQARSLLGWASPDALPAHFKLLGVRIVEPHSLAGDEGAIFLWVEAVDADNFPSGDPRLYRLPYHARLAERAEAAARASAQGMPQGGRTADFGAGAGGAAEPTNREITPSAVTVTSGGDPMSGGPSDPQIVKDQAHGVVFSPLPPPRLPPKDAP